MGLTAGRIRGSLITNENLAGGSSVAVPTNEGHEPPRDYPLAALEILGGWNITTTRRDRQRGHMSRPSKLDSGKFGSRVHINVSRSSSRL